MPRPRAGVVRCVEELSCPLLKASIGEDSNLGASPVSAYVVFLTFGAVALVVSVILGMERKGRVLGELLR